MPKEGDDVYDQQCDIIFKPKNLRLQTWFVTFEDKTHLQHIREDLINDAFVVGVKSHQKNPPSDFDKFKFCDRLLYHDGLLYVLKGLA